MHQFHVHSAAGAATFDGTGVLFAHLDALLGTGETFSVCLPKLAIDAVRGIMAFLGRHRIEVVLIADSAPEAVDYIAQTLLGAAAGSIGGCIGGVWVLSVLSRIGYLVPGVRWFLTAATFAGFLVGAVAGFAATRWGLRVQFAYAEMLEVDLVPLQT